MAKKRKKRGGVTLQSVQRALLKKMSKHDSDIKRILKHPMLVGIKLWALAHLIANGDLGSIVLFGSVLAWAVYDRITLKRRTDAGAPPIPVGGRSNDIIAVVVGTILYLALGFVFHPLVIGVPVFGKGGM